MFFKSVLLVLLCAIGVTFGTHSCYTCMYTAASTDLSCITITNSTTQTICPFRFCTIVRQEHLDPPGTIFSLTRACEQTPSYINNEITDAHFRTFYRACTGNLCNIGDGIEAISGSLSPTPEFSGENLLVPGTRSRSKAINLKSGLLSIVVSTVVISYLR